MNILFLTPWYPSKQDAMSGLFVQKHVEAVRAQGLEVRVLHSQTWRETWRQWRALRREGWWPDVVQLNVIQKQGLLALWLKKRYGIPYVLVEHWSGYLPESRQFMDMPALKRKVFLRVAAEASGIWTVSGRLAEAMRACGVSNAHWGTIDNVVDGFFFAPEERKYEKAEVGSQAKKTLLYVSCFDERAKNVEGLLRGAKMLSEKRQDWRLVLVGTGTDYEKVRAYAKDLALPEGVLEWTGELPPQEVAEWMHRSDALVLSSRFETYGVVLAEAAVAGLPILSTPVGIAEEVGALIVPHEIAQHKPGRMAEFMETVLWQPAAAGFPSLELNRFSSEAIGKKLKQIYEEAFNRTKG